MKSNKCHVSGIKYVILQGSKYRPCSITDLCKHFIISYQGDYRYKRPYWPGSINLSRRISFGQFVSTNIISGNLSPIQKLSVKSILFVGVFDRKHKLIPLHHAAHPKRRQFAIGLKPLSKVGSMPLFMLVSYNSHSHQYTCYYSRAP